MFRRTRLGAIDRGLDAGDAPVFSRNFPPDLLLCPTERGDFLLETRTICTDRWRVRRISWRFRRISTRADGIFTRVMCFPAISIQQSCGVHRHATISVGCRRDSVGKDGETCSNFHDPCGSARLLGGTARDRVDNADMLYGQRGLLGGHLADRPGDAGDFGGCVALPCGLIRDQTRTAAPHIACRRLPGHSLLRIAALHDTSPIC